MSDIPSADFSILHLSDKQLQILKPVKVLDIYAANGDDFHEDGLFSVSIFGRVGDAMRDTTFSYIHTGITILHPLVFRNILKLKRLYGEIIKGNEYAIFNDKINDFEKSNAIDGETGYNFFLSYWDRLKFERNDSKRRNARIDFIEKYHDVALTKNILVLPAGLRDIEVNPNGRDEEGEINEFYRKIISITNTLSGNIDLDNRLTDSARLGIQNAFNSIYVYIMTIVEKKRGFILQKWAKRKVFNATAGVLTANVPTIDELDDNDYAGWNHTQLGIAQVIKGLLPVAVHKLLTFPIVQEAFTGGSTEVSLLDKKTLKRVMVNISNKTLDKWTTTKGVEGLFQTFMDHNVRSSIVTIEGHYLGLVYRGDDSTFKVLYDIDEADEYDWMDKKRIYPITWIEMVYLMGYKDWNKYPTIPSRYPISGAGSIYPSFVFVRTTTEYEKRWEVDNEGNRIEDNVAIVYPKLDNPTFTDSISVHGSRLAGLGAD